MIYGKRPTQVEVDELAEFGMARHPFFGDGDVCQVWNDDEQEICGWSEQDHNEEPSRITGPVSIADDLVVYGVYDPRNRWNGWLNPSIDAWSVQVVLERLRDFYVSEGDREGCPVWHWCSAEGCGALVLQDGQEGPSEHLEPNDDGLYPLGYYGWTWSEATISSLIDDRLPHPDGAE